MRPVSVNRGGQWTSFTTFHNFRQQKDRDISTLLWPFLAPSVQVNDKLSHLSCLTPGGWAPYMLWSLMGCVAQLVSTESPQLLKNVKIEWNTCLLKDFHPGRMIISIHVDKMHNSAGNEEMVESSVSGFSITSHSGVWIHDSVDKAAI